MEPEKILFFWQRVSSLSFARFQCIKRAHEIYPQSKIEIITDEDVMPTWVDITPINPVREAVREKYGSDVADSFMQLSDYTRVEWLVKNPYSLYLDTDAYLLQRLNLESRMACANGIYCIWSGGDGKVISECFEKHRNGKQILYDFSRCLILNGARNIDEQILHKEKNIKKFLNI